MKTQPIAQPLKMEGTAYCPICTHTVPAQIQVLGKRSARVTPGQKCRRCSSALDAGIVVSVLQAA
jgi:hypothetical protein